jgi:hypothetical protein
MNFARPLEHIRRVTVSCKSQVINRILISVVTGVSPQATAAEVEQWTGGIIVQRTGGLIILYRGASYSSDELTKRIARLAALEPPGT